MVTLVGKKTKCRDAYLTEETLSAVADYKKEIAASSKDIIFPPGQGTNPANKWVKKVKKYFQKRGQSVQTHDFRRTTLTNMYRQSKDITLVQHYAGHSKIDTTQKYIEVDTVSLKKVLAKTLV